jgi:phosphatidylglycerophosphate synthase
MLDASLRPLLAPLLTRIAAQFRAWGLSANQVTAAGFILSLFAFAALVFSCYGWALFFLACGRLMDGVDGTLARQTEPTDLGGFLDIVSDFVFYSGMVFFFAVGRPEVALAAAFLIFAFVGSGSSFLAYAIVAAKRGLGNAGRDKKSFMYLGGLTEGSESIAALAALCIFPDYFTSIAYGFGALCWLTTIGRVRRAVLDFASTIADDR